MARFSEQSAATSAYSKYASEITNLKCQLEKIERDRDEQAQESSSKAAEYSRLQAEQEKKFVDLQSELAKAKTTLLDLSNRFDKVNEQNESSLQAAAATNTLDAQQQSRNALSDQVRALAEKERTVSQQLADLRLLTTKDDEGHNAAISRAKETEAKLREEIDGLKVRCSEKEQRIADLGNQVSSITKEKRDVERELADLQGYSEDLCTDSLQKVGVSNEKVALTDIYQRQTQSVAFEHSTILDLGGRTLTEVDEVARDVLLIAQIVDRGVEPEGLDHLDRLYRLWRTWESGSGPPLSDRERIFTMLYQLSSSIIGRGLLPTPVVGNLVTWLALRLACSLVRLGPPDLDHNELLGKIEVTSPELPQYLKLAVSRLRHLASVGATQRFPEPLSLHRRILKGTPNTRDGDYHSFRCLTGPDTDPVHVTICQIGELAHVECQIEGKSAYVFHDSKTKYPLFAYRLSFWLGIYARNEYWSIFPYDEDIFIDWFRHGGGKGLVRPTPPDDGGEIYARWVGDNT